MSGSAQTRDMQSDIIQPKSKASVLEMTPAELQSLQSEFEHQQTIINDLQKRLAGRQDHVRQQNRKISKLVGKHNMLEASVTVAEKALEIKDEELLHVTDKMDRVKAVHESTLLENETLREEFKKSDADNTRLTELVIRYRRERTEYKELWKSLRNDVKARVDEDILLPELKRLRTGLSTTSSRENREVRESPPLDTHRDPSQDISLHPLGGPPEEAVTPEDNQQDATTPSADGHPDNMITHDTQPNTTARRAPLVMQQNTWWAIDNVLRPGAVFDPIPATVIEKVRSQIRSWDQQNKKWRRAGLVDIICGWSAYRKKKTVWSEDGNEGKFACQWCATAGRVCCLVKQGKIQPLPISREGNSLGPGNEGYWFRRV